MEIFGIHCILCSGPLAVINYVNGTMHTQCQNCGHVARPEPKLLKNNQVYSKFAKKSVEVAYSRSKSTPPPSSTAKSGTYPRVHYASAGLRKCGER